MASYSKRKTKKGEVWGVRFRVVENGEEVNKNLSPFPTKKKAEEAYREYIASYIATDAPTADITFNSLYTAFKVYSKTRLKESSYYDLHTKVENHILPCFRDYKMKGITPIIILNWQNSINEYSYQYKCNLRSYLSAIIKFGIKYYDLVENPLNKVDTFRNLKPNYEIQIWTFDEFTRFYKAIDKIEYKAFFLFLYCTSCRKGEALALEWGKFDFEKGTVKIDASITRKVETKGWHITTPKNHSSVREISLPPNLIELLIEYKQAQAKQYDNIRFVFGSIAPFSDNTIRRRLLCYANKSSVKEIRIHDIRHSSISHLLSSGASIVAVSKRAGHKNVTQTLNTYAHFMPKDDTQILNLFKL